MFNLTKQDAHVVTQQTLDALWNKAEQLGRVNVDHPLFNLDYRVEIMFENRSGSRIYARGQARRIHDALESAIKEAISLGAVARI